MKILTAIGAATVAQAIVLPDSTFIDRPVRTRIGHLADSSEKILDLFTSKVKDEAKHAEGILEDVLVNSLDVDYFHNHDTSRFMPKISSMEHDHSNFTIYELITKSHHTTEFAKLLEKHEDVVKLLNDSEACLTLFAPIDKAFEGIPDDHKKPSDEFVDDVLNYYIGNGSYPAKRILGTQTIPTVYNEKWLGGEAQRLRLSAGVFSGLRVNAYSKIVAADFKAKNGYIHAVNKILVPPPMIGRVISLFPTEFSTLLLAYEKTNFVDFIHHVPMVGSTVFAPSNGAWGRLGVKANAFLFNTETGKKFLTALLKYQIVANTTVYSDEIYYGGDCDEEKKNGQTTRRGHFHIELPTLLEGKSLGLDIHSWHGFVSLVVNGYAKVGFRDVIGKNGVVQVVEQVPLPPCKREHRGHRMQVEGEIDVEDLKERLAEFVDEEDGDYEYAEEEEGGYEGDDEEEWNDL